MGGGRYQVIVCGPERSMSIGLLGVQRHLINFTQYMTDVVLNSTGDICVQYPSLVLTRPHVLMLFANVNQKVVRMSPPTIPSHNPNTYTLY